MSIRLLAAICALTGLFSGSAAADIFSRLIPLAETPAVAPGGWFAPFALDLASPDGEELTEISLAVEGLSIGEADEVGLFREPGAVFSVQGIFPWEGNRAETEADVSDFPRLRLRLKKPLGLPLHLDGEIDLQAGVKLAGTVRAERLALRLVGLRFARSGGVSLNARREASLDREPPEAEISVAAGRRGQLSGRLFTLRPSEPLACAPRLRPLWPEKMTVKDWHAWRRAPIWASAFDCSQSPIEPEGYEFFLPRLRLLSGNFSSVKPLTYELVPPPDAWKWRADQGQDLLDGDAQPGKFVMPGGVQWLNGEQACVLVNLPEPTEIAGVVLYLQPRTFRGGRILLGPNREHLAAVGELPPATSPFSRYECEPESAREKAGLELSRICAFLSSAPRGSCLALDLKFARQLTLTELEIWGPAEPDDPQPTQVLIELIDRAGNRSRRLWHEQGPVLGSP